MSKSKAKKHGNMDRTSASMATYLDKRRKASKNPAARKRSSRDRTSLSRGGFR